MIRFLRKIFESKQIDSDVNASLTILTKALPAEVDLNSISKIVFICAIEYSKEVYEELKLAIDQDEIHKISSEHSFNVMKDGVEIYLFIGKDNSQFLCTLFSPYEVYDNEYVIDIIDLKYELDFSLYKNSEVIYAVMDK